MGNVIVDNVRAAIEAAEDRFQAVEQLRRLLHELSPNAGMPVDFVRWIPIEKVKPNDYNPNSVAKIELQLLATSIDHDGYTQPVVTIQEKACEITLPCGAILYINEKEVPQCQILKTVDLQIGSSATQPGYWTVRDQLDFSMERINKNGEVGIECRLVKPSPIMDKTCVNGLDAPGTWGVYTASPTSARSMYGTLQGIMMSSGCLEIVCPICASNDPEHKKHWTSWQANQPSGVEFGLHVSCISSKLLEATHEPKILQSDCNGAYTQLEPSEMNSALTLPIGTRGPDLHSTNLTQLIIVDGFHRYYIMQQNAAIRERCHGLLPCVVIDKPINDRMASTIRHNRARGKHSINGMSSMVFNMLENGWSDAEICNELGMEPEEVLRLKHITGFSKLFSDVEYSRAWVTRRQILIKKKHEEEHSS